MQAIVKQLSLYGKLEGHDGCVNAVEFNSTGDLLVSGSDDQQVMFWNWASKTKLLEYPSGHSENIFQTKILPFSDDRKIVTSAGDGEVSFSVPCILCNSLGQQSFFYFYSLLLKKGNSQLQCIAMSFLILWRLVILPCYCCASCPLLSFSICQCRLINLHAWSLVYHRGNILKL